MEKINAVIVDDESNGRHVLSQLLKDHCPEIELSGVAASASEARELVAEHEPDVVFLDIMMPVETGFDFLEGFDDRAFSVVFVTAYQEHAIQAIKASAVDYLLKPVDVVELKESIQKLCSLHNLETRSIDVQAQSRKIQTNVLYKNLELNGPLSRIILHRPRGIKVVNLSEILYIRSDAHYTTVRLAEDGDLIVTGSLKDFEQILGSSYFCRVHKSHLINLMHVTEYSFSATGRASLSNGEKLIVSKRRTRQFLDQLERYAGINGKVNPIK